MLILIYYRCTYIPTKEDYIYRRFRPLFWYYAYLPLHDSEDYIYLLYRHVLFNIALQNELPHAYMALTKYFSRSTAFGELLDDFIYTTGYSTAKQRHTATYYQKLPAKNAYMKICRAISRYHFSHIHYII